MKTSQSRKNTLKIIIIKKKKVQKTNQSQVKKERDAGVKNLSVKNTHREINTKNEQNSHAAALLAERLEIH